ncbi:MAG: hypothetical protein PHO27_09835 [Sulfuricurvum sp.]|nr:hypothetical protein [Sulfuricurvum sp.]
MTHANDIDIFRREFCKLSISGLGIFALGGVSLLSSGCGGGGSSSAGTSAALTNDQIRNNALDIMRQTDLSPMLYESGNWSNGAYNDWIRYLTKQITETQYVTARSSSPYASYYPTLETYQFNQLPDTPVDYTLVYTSNARGYLDNRSDYNVLSHRFYYNNSDPLYLTTWINIMHDMMLRERNLVGQHYLDTSTGNGGNLLSMSFFLATLVYTLALFAKSTGRPTTGTGSGWGTNDIAAKPQSTALTDTQKALFPSDKILDIVKALINNYSAPFITYGVTNRPPNQKLTYIAWMAMLTHFFPDVIEVKNISGQVDSLMSAFLAQDTYRDGGVIEQSFNYSDDVINWLTRLQRLTSRSWSATASSAIESYWRQAAAICNPFGARPTMDIASWSTAPSTNIPTATFSQTSIAFPYSGFYIQRSDWSSNGAYMFLFSRRAAAGHYMPASNSIQVAAYGRTLLNVAAYHSYSGYSNCNAYLAESSTWKSTTIIVDGHSQSRGGSAANIQFDSNGNFQTVDPIRSRWGTSNVFDFMESTHDADYTYDPYTSKTNASTGVVHKRMIVFIRELKVWVIADYLIPTSGGNHNYTQIWRFPSPTNGGFDLSQVVVPTSGSLKRLYTNDTASGAVNLSIYQSAPQTITHASYFGSTDPNTLYGFDNTPNPTISGASSFSCDVHTTWSGNTAQAIISLLVPFQGSDGVTASSNTSSGSNAGLNAIINGNTINVSAIPATTAEQCAFTLAYTNSNGTQNVVIGDLATASASYMEFVHGTKQPLLVPSGFHWSTDGAGVLTANYTA